MDDHHSQSVGDVVVPDVDGSTQPPPPDVQPDQDAHKESEHAAHNAQYYQHGVVHPIPQYAYMSNSLVPAGGMPPPQFAVPLGMAQTPGPLPPLSPNSLAKVQGANQWPSVAFSRGPDKKKRQREDFNTSQLKRLVEVYDMEESQRPDREQLAKELDQLDGGRNVDSAAIKAWMKNRFHSLKRTAGARSLVPGERKERQDFNSAQLKRLCEVYDMDPTQRPDREIVAKEIDKLEGGRPVTQYDVLAWMQTRKRMIKKKEERNALNKDPDALRSGVNMHAMPPQPQIAGVQASWQMQQPTFLVHPPHPPPEGQPPPPPDGDLPQVHLPPGVVAHAPASVVMPVGVIGGGIGVGGMPVSKGLKNDRIKRPRMDYNDAQVFRLVQAYDSMEKQDPEKLAKEIDGLEGGRSVDATAVKAWLKNRLRFSEADRKKRQRYDFNQTQLKRLLEVYELPENERPDRELLAQELDGVEGGRRCTRADVKAWLKNRHHANRRRSGQEPNSSLHAKLRKASQGDLKKRGMGIPMDGPMGMALEAQAGMHMVPGQQLDPQLSHQPPAPGAEGSKTVEHFLHFVGQAQARWHQYLHHRIAEVSEVHHEAHGQVPADSADMPKHLEVRDVEGPEVHHDGDGVSEVVHPGHEVDDSEADGVGHHDLGHGEHEGEEHGEEGEVVVHPTITAVAPHPDEEPPPPPKDLV